MLNISNPFIVFFVREILCLFSIFVFYPASFVKKGWFDWVVRSAFKPLYEKSVSSKIKNVFYLYAKYIGLISIKLL
jgi:hypothetical protein